MMRRMLAGTLLWLCCSAVFLRPLSGQDAIPLVTGPLSAADKSAKLPVEIIAVTRFGALPNSINRAPGKFILLVLNKTLYSQDAYSLEPVAVGNASAPATAAVRLGGALAQNRKSAALLNLPVGQYELKSAATGTVLCQITIN